MKRITAAAVAAAMAFGLTGCTSRVAVGENLDATGYDISSEMYTDKDMDYALEHMQGIVDSLGGVVDDLSYLGDEYCTDDAVLYKLDTLFEKDKQGYYTEYMGFDIDFHYSKSPKAVFGEMINGNWGYITYPAVHHQIWFAKDSNGQWEEAFVFDEDVMQVS